MKPRIVSPLVTVSITTSQDVYRLLCELEKTGMFGTSVQDVAEQLLREKLREVELARKARR